MRINESGDALITTVQVRATPERPSGPKVLQFVTDSLVISARSLPLSKSSMVIFLGRSFGPPASGPLSGPARGLPNIFLGSNGMEPPLEVSGVLEQDELNPRDAVLVELGVRGPSG